MPRPRSNFLLISKPETSGRRYWIAIFWDPTTGKRARRSSGVEDDGTETSRLRAEALAIDAFNHLQEVAGPNLGAVTFAKFAAGFWDWETSPYIAARLARDPMALSEGHCANQASALRRHVLPTLGPMRMEAITPDVLDNLVTLLLMSLSSASVKHVIDAVRPIFEQAVRKRVLKYNPVPSMLPFTARHRQRDAFTPEEIKRLLDPLAIGRLWADPTARQERYRSGGLYWGLAALCFVTGARFGAVVALRREDLVETVFAGVRYFEVHLERSLAAKVGIKAGSKTGKGTVVPVPAEVVDLLAPNLPTEGLLFPSFGGHGVLTHHTAAKHLHRAIARAKIKNPASRLLGFHAFRHAFVTQASAAGMTQAQIASFTEHKDEATTAGYTHLRPKDLLAALPIQREFLTGRI